MRNCASVAFLCYLGAAAGDVYTLTEATTAAGGGAQVLATITRFWTSTGDGTDQWVLRTQAAGSTVTTAAAATQNAAVIHVAGAELSDGYDFIKVASTGAGTVNALPYDLVVQRDPAKLAAAGA
jgi:hypothetical protein